MLFTPRPLSEMTLSKEVLKADKKDAHSFDQCSLGKLALYVGSYGLSNVYYIPLSRVNRVFKRLAVSKGFYEKGKIFGSLCYLVIRYDGTKEKVVRFTHEEDLNDMLNAFRKFTTIPVGKP